MIGLGVGQAREGRFAWKHDYLLPCGYGVAIERLSAQMQGARGSCVVTVALLLVSLTCTARAAAIGVDAIGRANLDGSDVEQSFVRTQRSSTSVAVGADQIYWGWLGSPAEHLSPSIGRATLDGSSVQPTFLTVPAGVYGVAVDGRHIFWRGGAAGWIGRADLDGTNLDADFIANAAGSAALEIDAGHIYWGSQTNNVFAIGRANLDGSGVNPSFILIPWMARDIAIDSAHIYWSDGAAKIGRANLDGSAVTPDFITGLESTNGLAVDPGHIYWATPREPVNAVATRPPSTIGRANLDGSGVEPSFISSDSKIFGVAVDAGHIYWTNTSYEPCGLCHGPDPPEPVPVPPNTRITKGASDRTHQSRVKFIFASGDYDVAFFQCRTDKRPWVWCDSPHTTRRLDPGKHQFRVRAVDREFNADPTPAKDRFTVVG